MKILMALMAGIIFMMNFSISSAANIMDYPRVAVMQFGNKAITSSGLREFDFDSASEYAIYQLAASGWFDLIDYEQLNAIAKMHNINNSGMVDPATVVQMGKFAGAQFMVVGNVTGLTTKAGGLEYEHGRKAGLNVKNRTVIANVAMRIVDIETGRIAVAGLGKGESSSANVEIAFKKYRNKNNTLNQMNDGYSVPSDTSMGNNGDGTNVSYPESTDPYQETNNPYPESTDPYQETNSPYPESTDPYQETNNPYPESTDPYQETNSPYAEINDPYIETNNQDYGYGGYEDNGVEEMESYVIRIGTEDFSDVQVRNAISKAVRDAVYGKMGLLTTLNGGKQLKIKTGF